MNRTGEWEPFDIMYLNGEYVMVQCFMKDKLPVLKILARVSWI